MKTLPQARTAEAARLLRETRFNSYVPCGVCGTHIRQTSNYACVECQRVKKARQRAEAAKYQTPDMLSREDAIAMGLDYYLTGRPCTRGHETVRDTATGRCYTCMIRYGR